MLYIEAAPLKSSNRSTSDLLRQWYISPCIPLKTKCPGVTLTQTPLLEAVFEIRIEKVFAFLNKKKKKALVPKLMTVFHSHPTCPLAKEQELHPKTGTPLANCMPSLRKIGRI